MHLGKFRFNKTFHLIGAEEFLKDMLNSTEVPKQFRPLNGLGTVSDIKFTQMNCNVLNMSYFDIFETLNLTGINGALRGAME
jgi:hypothetical protein